MIAGMRTIACPIANGDFCATRDGWQDDFATTPARQLLPADVPTGLTRSGMTDFSTLMRSAGQLFLADHRTRVWVVLLAARLLTLVSTTAHLFVAPPAADEDSFLQRRAFNRFRRRRALALDHGLQLAWTARAIVTRLLTLMQVA